MDFPIRSPGAKNHYFLSPIFNENRAIFPSSARFCRIGHFQTCFCNAKAGPNPFQCPFSAENGHFHTRFPTENGSNFVQCPISAEIGHFLPVFAKRKRAQTATNPREAWISCPFWPRQNGPNPNDQTRDAQTFTISNLGPLPRFEIVKV